jgi:hypothetical protein
MSALEASYASSRNIMGNEAFNYTCSGIHAMSYHFTTFIPTAPTALVHCTIRTTIVTTFPANTTSLRIVKVRHPFVVYLTSPLL